MIVKARRVNINMKILIPFPNLSSTQVKKQTIKDEKDTTRKSLLSNGEYFCLVQ